MLPACFCSNAPSSVCSVRQCNMDASKGPCPYSYINMWPRCNMWPTCCLRHPNGASSSLHLASIPQYLLLTYYLILKWNKFNKRNWFVSIYMLQYQCNKSLHIFWSFCKWSDYESQLAVGDEADLRGWLRSGHGGRRKHTLTLKSRKKQGQNLESSVTQ